MARAWSESVSALSCQTRRRGLRDGGCSIAARGWEDGGGARGARVSGACCCGCCGVSASQVAGGLRVRSTRRGGRLVGSPCWRGLSSGVSLSDSIPFGNRRVSGNQRPGAHFGTKATSLRRLL
eukprot:scaffold19506_cov68-Phaeocystis_antarctica.AAC.4